MEYIKTCDCIKCENLILDDIMEDYICKIETDGIHEYVGGTKWQIEDEQKLRRCLKST